jgi:formiminotetrahydrofolate cyclodeaminase
MNLALEAASTGNPNCISDAGVAGEMAHAGAHGAALNVLINLKEIQDKTFCNDLKKKTTLLLHETNELLISIRDTVKEILENG